MKVGQLVAGFRVFIEAKKDDVTDTWESTVCEIVAEEDLLAIAKLKERFLDFDFCFVNPIYENNMVLDFGSKDVVKNLVILRGTDPYAWHGVTVFNVTLPKYGRVHAVAALTQELPHNRRGSYRIRILKPGEMHVSGIENVRKVMVNDISATGIGLVVDDTDGVSDNLRVKVCFQDDMRFELDAVVRRIKPLSEKRSIVGCEFVKPSDTVAQFVNLKQIKLKKSQQQHFRKT